MSTPSSECCHAAKAKTAATKKRTRLADNVELAAKKQKLQKLSKDICKALNVLTSSTGETVGKASGTLFSADASVKGVCTSTLRFFSQLSIICSLSFFICVCAVLCLYHTQISRFSLCVYLVLLLFLSNFYALFTCLCYQWVLHSLKVWFWNLSSLLRLMPRRRRKKTSAVYVRYWQKADGSYIYHCHNFA